VADWKLEGKHPLLEDYVTDVFVETGTYYGDGVIAALAAGFPKVITIEIIDTIFKDAQAKFEEILTEEERSRLSMRLGSSLEMLPAVVDMLNKTGKQATFWLDAHVQGRKQPDDRHPLAREVNLLGRLERKDHIIMMDDLRRWRSWGVRHAHIGAALQRINPDYAIELLPGIIKDDVMLAWIPQ
jgi:hypothetical protein